MLSPRLIRLQEPQFRASRRTQEINQITGLGGSEGWKEEWIQYKVRRQREFAETAWKFSEPIPEAVRRAVRKFNQSHYELLQAFAAVHYAMELYQSNAALFYALIRNDQFLTDPPRARLAACRRWILHKQHEIAEWLEFPEDAAKTCVRILAKLLPQDVRIHRLWWLRRMLADPELRKLLVFAPRIDATVIGFVWDTRALLHAKLAGKLVQRLDTKVLFESRLIARDIVRMWRLLDRPWPPNQKLQGINALENLHDELQRAYTRLARSSGLVVRCLEKPLPEWPDIELLGTTEEIIAEGDELDHCVSSFIPEMVLGETPILLYRVLWPERATLRLIKTGERWHVAELRCHKNRAPSPETFEFVKSWLDQAQTTVEMGFPQRAEENIDPDLCPF